MGIKANGKLNLDISPENSFAAGNTILVLGKRTKAIQEILSHMKKQLKKNKVHAILVLTASMMSERKYSFFCCITNIT